MAQMIPATAGQSGSASLIGGLAGVIGGSSTDDDLKPRYYSDVTNNIANNYARLLRARDLKPLNTEYTALYRANDPLARENASFYDEQARGILGDNTRTADTYERLRSGNLSSLSDVFKNVLDYGLASQKARLAAGGYGGSGPSSYDRILNSTMTASNLSPVLNTIYGNLGRDASSAVGGDRAWDAYRMGQFAQDPLTGYVDAATAGRVYQPLNAYRNAINGNTSSLSNILNGVIIPNVAGYDLIPGLGSRLNNSAAGVMNAMNFATSMYGNIAGMGGGGGAPAATPGGAPQMMPAGGYPTMGNTTGAMPPAQNQAWMNEFNGGGIQNVPYSAPQVPQGGSYWPGSVNPYQPQPSYQPNYGSSYWPNTLG